VQRYISHHGQLNGVKQGRLNMAHAAKYEVGFRGKERQKQRVADLEEQFEKADLAEQP
jgi:hypothetical protein